MISHFFTRPRAEARLPWQPSTTAPQCDNIFYGIGNSIGISYSMKRSPEELILRASFVSSWK